MLFILEERFRLSQGTPSCTRNPSLREMKERNRWSSEGTVTRVVLVDTTKTTVPHVMWSPATTGPTPAGVPGYQEGKQDRGSGMKGMHVQSGG